ncbi:hypothetical protein C8J57DRAFT_1523833 [Mycena rebaudengoi]|nr:hypothetical protein C8J57DRAFT_1523833 [Mycena rebaudengoi]
MICATASSQLKDVFLFLSASPVGCHHGWTLRSGKEFSPFEIAVGVPITPAQYFSVGDLLSQRLAEQALTGVYDEPEEIWTTPPTPSSSSHTSFPLAPLVLTPSSPSSPTPLARPFSSCTDPKKRAFKIRRQKQRALDQAAREIAGDSSTKNVHAKRRKTADTNRIQLEMDATDLSHSKPAWIGDRNAESAPSPEPPASSSAPPPAPSPSSSASPPHGLGGATYTQEHVDKLSGTKDFRYIDWLGLITIQILDSHRRLIALLGGKPKDLVGWQIVTDGCAKLLEAQMARGKFSEDDLNHRRAQEPYPSISRGISFGGGQTEPGELCNNEENIRLSDELLAHPFFKRLDGWANCLFRIFASVLYMFYQEQMGLITRWNPNLVWNFVGSIFAACTFNFGPHAITVPHLDFGNLAWGWCSITALGNFDPDLGGHLILWDLKLVIRFPPGSTILIPSAIIRHLNVPVQAHERRFSFTQYSAGGLFRWIRNGFQTEEAFQQKASASEKASRNAESEVRWAEGMGRFGHLGLYSGFAVQLLKIILAT